MALRPCCDVFNTAAGVKKYAVMVFELDDEGETTGKGSTVKVDLSPRGLERLNVKIETGTTPPRKRKAGDAT